MKIVEEIFKMHPEKWENKQTFEFIKKKSMEKICMKLRQYILKEGRNFMDSIIGMFRSNKNTFKIHSYLP